MFRAPISKLVASLGLISPSPYDTWVYKAGVRRVIINGSFVTDALEPNDVDCVLLTWADAPHDPDAVEELIDGLPFVDMELVEAKEFAILVEQYFATDRDSNPKGVIEVIL